jgi:serine/threonine protein kinase
MKGTFLRNLKIIKSFLTLQIVYAAHRNKSSIHKNIVHLDIKPANILFVTSIGNLVKWYIIFNQSLFSDI